MQSKCSFNVFTLVKFVFYEFQNVINVSRVRFMKSKKCLNIKDRDLKLSTKLRMNER
jgi:hypothetical protein